MVLSWIQKLSVWSYKLDLNIMAKSNWAIITKTGVVIDLRVVAGNIINISEEERNWARWCTVAVHQVHQTFYIKKWLIALLHSLIACRWIRRQTLWWSRPKAIHFSRLGPELSSVSRSTGAQLMFFFCFRFPGVVVWRSLDFWPSRNTLYLLSPRLCFFIVSNLDLFVNRDDSLTSSLCEPNNQLNVCTTSVTEGEVGAVKLV